MPRPTVEIRDIAVTTNVTLTTTDEIEVAELLGISTVQPDETVLIIGAFQFTSGTLATAITPRVRRGATVAGTLVGEANAVTLGAAAGSTEVIAAWGVDRPGAVASQAYIVSLQQTGASGDGTVLYGLVVAFVF